MADWKDKLILAAGESLRLDRSFSKGFMQEEDVEEYSVVATDGSIRGTVTFTDHTAVKGFKRTRRVVQFNSEKKVVLDSRWDV